MWLVVKVSAKDLPSLLPETLLGSEQWSTTNAIFTHFKDLWTVAPTSFKFVQLQLPKGRCLEILVDTSDPVTQAVYFMWFTT